MNPLVSVVMSVHNGDRYLRTSIDSVLAQDYTNFEFIIIDDGSTDGTSEILNTYRDPRIRVEHNQVNMGLIKSLNKGLSIARGYYVARMDADDICKPDRFSRQVDFFERHPEIGVLGTACQIIDQAGSPTGRYLRYPTKPHMVRWSLCFYDPIVHPSVMTRKHLMILAGGYDEGFPSAEDYELWCRLSWVTELANLDRVLLLYREHSDSVTATKYPEMRANSVRISLKMISEVLRAPVPSDSQYALWSCREPNNLDVWRTAQLISRLYQAFLANNSLSDAAKQDIRRDAAERLFVLWGGSYRRPSRWPILVHLWVMDPARLKRALGNFLNRLGTTLGGQ